MKFTSRARTVTEADVVAFAGLTGDFHPQHVDAEWAAESVFGERIAHGLLVLGLAAGLAPLDPERVVALRRVRDVVFKRPVRLGDTIHVEGELGEPGAGGIASVTLRVLSADRLAARIVLDVILAEDAEPSETLNGAWHFSEGCVPL